MLKMKLLISIFRSTNLFRRCNIFDIYHNKKNVRQKSNDLKEKNCIHRKLEEIISFKTKKTTSWIIETKVDSLCQHYNTLLKEEKIKFLLLIASKYAVNHKKICQLANELYNEANNLNQLIARERAFKDALIPPYHWLFIRIGRLEYGVKFLVDLRANVLDLISQSSKDSKDILVLVQMDITLKDLLFLWFSVGFMKIKRITWKTSCDILQKISDYEAIHPMRNWTDLKKRVGPYRRCFIFTHPSMPREPLVVLHTALCDVIPDSVKGIQEAENRILGKITPKEERIEDKTKIKAAIFYSIASTQSGLQGIELGNYLIKEVAKQITSEFPMIDQLSSLSPVPNFRLWLLSKIKRDINMIFTNSEQQYINCDLHQNQGTNSTENLYQDLKKMFNNSFWQKNEKLAAILKKPLLRSCAWYLFKEKRRNYCLNNVANFHLRNGAIIWRINWLADLSPRGMENSCGIMVNYRYHLNETELNSINYIENYYIRASDSVMYLVSQAEKLHATVSVNTKEDIL